MPRNLQVLAPQNASTNHDSLPACAPARYASAPVALTRENLSAKSFAQVVRQLRNSQNNAQYTSTTICIVRYGCQVSEKKRIRLRVMFATLHRYSFLATPYTGGKRTQKNNHTLPRGVPSPRLLLHAKAEQNETWRLRNLSEKTNPCCPLWYVRVAFYLCNHSPLADWMVKISTTVCPILSSASRGTHYGSFATLPAKQATPCQSAVRNGRCNFVKQAHESRSSHRSTLKKWSLRSARPDQDKYQAG